MFEPLSYSTFGTLLFLGLSFLTVVSLIFMVICFAKKKEKKVKKISIILVVSFFVATVTTFVILTAVYRAAQQRTIESFLARQEESFREDNELIYGSN